MSRALIYYPQPRSLAGGATMITMPVDEGQVLVTTRAHQGPNALVYFGGNAEDVSSSLPGLVRFRSGVASFKVVAGTGHNTISENPQYLALLKGVQ